MVAEVEDPARRIIYVGEGRFYASLASISVPSLS